MSMINRSKERIKETGEVFTPQHLVDEILDKLPPESFTDPTKTFVDPACGDGNFLVRVVAYKLACGSTIEQALSTTYGVDLMVDNVEECHRRLIEIADGVDGVDLDKCESIVAHNVVCANSLTEWDYDKWERKVDKKKQWDDNFLVF